jgi:penicillin-binding protein 1B
VRQQLQRDYKEDDVRSEGLLIFTAMDPIVQLTAETILQNRVKRLEKAYKISRGKLNGATMISTVQGAEVLALVGGMNVRYPGFNHILTAQRQIGSLVKPAIYLTALENKRKYTLATRVSDGPVTVKIGPKKYWQPENYDRRNMGVVTVLKALEMSRNTPAVRIGVDMGVDRVVSTLHLLGINAKIPEYPSILLGAVELTPFEVQQMYQTIAAGGSYTPLKAIRSVMNLKGQVLSRYPVNVQQVASPEAVDLLQYGLNQVTEQGTAKELSSVLPAWKKVGGKTGTTNDKKDSWFAGFSGQHVATVWVGRDDNKPIHMTGGEGALKVWADLFRVLPSKALQVQNSSRLVWVDIDSDTGLRFNPACGKAERVPFIKGSQPQKTNFCAPPVDETLPEGAVPVEGQAASTEATAPVARANPTPAPARAPAVRPAPPAVPAGNNASTPPDNSWIDTLMR